MPAAGVERDKIQRFMSETETLAPDRRLGELEGASFEATLAARERAERSERLSRIALARDEADLPADVPSAFSRRDRPELESRLRELTHFHDAVVRSRSWHLLQQVRRLFGRAW